MKIWMLLLYNVNILISPYLRIKGTETLFHLIFVNIYSLFYSIVILNTLKLRTIRLVRKYILDPKI